MLTPRKFIIADFRAKSKHRLFLGYIPKINALKCKKLLTYDEGWIYNKQVIEARASSVAGKEQGKLPAKGDPAEVCTPPERVCWDNAKDALYCRFGDIPRRSAIRLTCFLSRGTPTAFYIIQIIWRENKQ